MSPSAAPAQTHGHRLARVRLALWRQQTSGTLLREAGYLLTSCGVRKQLAVEQSYPSSVVGWVTARYHASVTGTVPRAVAHLLALNSLRQGLRWQQNVIQGGALIFAGFPAKPHIRAR